jgi:chromosome segregation ATPase
MSFFRGFGKPEEKGGLQSPSTPGKAPPPPPVVQDDNISIRLEDEPEEDPERTALESEVRDRDNQISVLERARQEKKDQLDALEAELEKERLTQMSEALIHKIESERIKRMTSHAEDRLQALEQDMQDKAAIHEYANLIKGVAPKGGVDSQYVMKLQAQLQKAVKKMETTMGQMKELEQNARENVEQLSAEIIQLIQERCKTELDLRKQIEVMEEQKKEMQVEYEARIRENLKTLKSLRAKAVKQSTIEELEEELQETEAKLEELSRIHEKQTISIEQLTKSLSSQGDM